VKPAKNLALEVRINRTMDTSALRSLLLLATAATIVTTCANADGSERTKLLKLARKQFTGQRILRAECELFAAVAEGRDADCANFAANEKIIRADRLSWLCTDTSAAKCISVKGISIIGAVIRGKLDLETAKIPFPFKARTCEFADEILLRDCHLFTLNLDGCVIKTLIADRLVVDGSIFLRSGFRAHERVDLTNAKISGQLDCSGAELLSEDDNIALSLRGVQSEGSVLLRDHFKARGLVDLEDAEIRGQVDCQGGEFCSPHGNIALNFNGAKIGQSVLLRGGFYSVGEVNLAFAKIGGALDCEHATFVAGNRGTALDLNLSKIEGSVFLRDRFKARGEVNLSAAKIGGDLECWNGTFIKDVTGTALNINSAQIDGSVFLIGQFFSQGSVDLRVAKVGRILQCSGGTFLGKDGGVALNARGVKIENAVFLNKGFSALGGVILKDAEIGGILNCNGGQFTGNEKLVALDISEAKIQGFVVLNKDLERAQDFEAEGGVYLIATTIGGDLECKGGRLVSKRKDVPALNAEGARISGAVYFDEKIVAEGMVRFTHASVARNFEWKDFESCNKATLDLRFTKVGTLLNDRYAQGRPSQGNLFLSGFNYDEIDEEASPEAVVQLGWIHLQPTEQFLSQPFEHLAAVLRNMGRQEEATKVMVAKNESEAEHTPLRWDRIGDWIWFRVGWLIGYGYRPMRALWISLVIISLGVLLFQAGYLSRVVAQSSDKAHTKFNSIVYSLETFVPLLKLGISESWSPNPYRKGTLKLGRLSLPMSGGILRIYLWIHIILGWLLTTLWVGALTGLVKT
jgi:hypothetical protein